MKAPTYKVTPLWALMVERGWTARDLKKRMPVGRKVSVMDIDDIAHGVRQATAEEFQSLASALRVTVAEVAGARRTKRVQCAVLSATVIAFKKRRKGIVDVDDLAFWSDAEVRCHATPDMLHCRFGYRTPAPTSPAPTSKPQAAGARPRGAGRPKARRVRATSASSSDDPDPEPAKPKRPTDLATRGKGRWVCTSCGSKYRPDAGTPDLCGPCHRRSHRKATGKRGGAAA